jgi:hypothetical protein
MLGFVNTEFPKLKSSEDAVKPYTMLWNLRKRWDQKNIEWTKNKVLSLNPEDVDKESKEMLHTANTLKVRVSLPHSLLFIFYIFLFNFALVWKKYCETSKLGNRTRLSNRRLQKTNQINSSFVQPWFKNKALEEIKRNSCGFCIGRREN